MPGSCFNEAAGVPRARGVGELVTLLTGILQGSSPRLRGNALGE